MWGAMRNVRSPASLCAGRAFAAVACGSVGTLMGGSRGVRRGYQRRPRVRKAARTVRHVGVAEAVAGDGGGSDADDAIRAGRTTSGRCVSTRAVTVVIGFR